MLIVVHDYPGHAFPLQLSRELARRGHRVIHLYSQDDRSPRGRMALQVGDASTLEIVGISMPGLFDKDNFFKRRSHEISYGKAVARTIRELVPDVVISANTPLDAQRYIQTACRSVRCSFVFWVQDLIGDAITRILGRKLGVVGRVVGVGYSALEAKMLRDSDRVVAITDGFLPYLQRSGVHAEKIDVVTNWAPIDELPSLPLNNDWRSENSLPNKVTFVYSGTLGHKHNPEILLDIAHRFDCNVLVFSEGPVANSLEQQATEKGVNNLHVRPWVSFEELPQVLAAADVLVTVIESDAARYSVPSKVLAYLCAGRPIVASMPSDNLAAEIIESEGAGFVCSPQDREQFLARAGQLIADTELREKMGEAGRSFAERNFRIQELGDRFEALIRKAVDQRLATENAAA